MSWRGSRRALGSGFKASEELSDPGRQRSARSQGLPRAKSLEPRACRPVSDSAGPAGIVQAWPTRRRWPTSSRPRSAATSSRIIRRFRSGTPTPSRPTPRPALASPAPPDVPLGLYLHIPFCRKRCHFCYFRVYTDKNAQRSRAVPRPAGARVGAVRGDSPRSPDGRFNFVYFGGGTPSFLSTKQLAGPGQPAQRRAARGTTPKRSRSSASPAR